ncbi:phospholipase D-like domain-containing protein [Acinetobacter sp. ANC 3882]|uniref:phospholipase D-like domain-containing protein n=1 Tax=Acinetobacter sp. ANC 3882 TaxID=2923423 RepID=UPI001F4A0E23|nr:phospholipase D-like domain-containing protein [Acinetobacter sp. ANC 3882]MCH7314364.1 phospholipase D-like domain-containing protein [Acinetobacter sp. ANC 3882]
MITIADTSPDYLSGPKLVDLFNIFGSRDDYHTMNKASSFPSRKDYAKNKISEINGTIHLKGFIETLVDDRRCSNPDHRASLINKILKHDGYVLEKGVDDIYRLNAGEMLEGATIKPVFEDIENAIIEHIGLAQFSIWVAVAWFTSRPIAKALYEQHKKGVNVRIIVNDDDLTRTRGIAFEESKMEYHKISPTNAVYKNIMHNKFCVIDLKKVITGSFNWTNKASFNSENITIIEQREQSEAFAKEFIKILNIK